MAIFAPNEGVDITIALTLNLLTVLGTIANVMVLVKVRQSVGSRHHYGVSQIIIAHLAVSNVIYLWSGSVPLALAMHRGVGPAGRKSLFNGVWGVVFCNLRGFWTDVTLRQGTYLTALLGCYRLRTICDPFHTHSRGLLYIVIGGCWTFNSVLGAYPWLFSTYQRGYIHNGRTGMCIWNVMSVLKPEQLTEVLIQVYDLLLIFLPSFLPAIPIILSCFGSIYKLRKRPKELRSSAETDQDGQSSNTCSKNNHRASVTIVLLTISDILCNISWWVFGLLGFSFSVAGKLDVFIRNAGGFQNIGYWEIVACHVGYPLNALLTPTIFLVRSYKVTVKLGFNRIARIFNKESQDTDGVDTVFEKY